MVGRIRVWGLYWMGVLDMKYTMTPQSPGSRSSDRTAPELTTAPTDHWSRVRLDAGSGVPIWVQIKTQLEYLIATGGVPEGTQLPSVRQLSSHLGVAIDTVRQAYDDLTRANLVATRRGRGTFTRLPETGAEERFSNRRVWAEANRLTLDALAGSSEPQDVAAALANRLRMLHHGMRIAWVGVGVSVDRYARQLAAELPAGTQVDALPLEDVRNDPSLLAEHTHVVTLVFHVTETARLAPAHSRVLPLMSRLDPGVLDQISGLPAGKVALISRSATSPVYQDLVTARRDDLELVAINDDRVASLDEHKDLVAVLHSTASSDRVTGHARPTGLPLVELTHRPQDKSLREVSQSLRADAEFLIELQRASTPARHTRPATATRS